MTADLNVNDYLEMVMLMIGWVINNTLWSSLTQTGLALVPFIALIASEWFKVRQEGEDEGNKGSLLVVRLETRLYAMVLCYAFTCAPIMDLSFNPVNATERTNADGNECSVSVIGQGQWGSTTLNAIGGQGAEIPLWWAFVHAVSKGITNVAVSSIPCTPDLQAITSEIDAQEISDPGLRHELGEFQRQCYGAARNKLFREAGAIDATDAMDVDWLGSEYFLNTPGYYDTFYAGRPVTGFPYDASRDQARPGTGPGRPGYPRCSEWWSDENAGLYSRLHDQVDPGLWDNLSSVFSSTDAEGKVIRRLISQRAGSANGNQSVAVTGYGNLDGDVLDDVGDTVSMAVGGVGGAAAGVLGKAGMDMLKRALPMVQYILIMAVVICLPFVMIVSGYSFKVAGTATFGLFALWFLTFWWELARWINSNLIDLIYDSDAAKMSFIAAGQNGYDKLVLVFVEWATFLILPGIWVTILGWAGMKVGGAIGGLSEGVSGAQKAGNEGSKIASKAATKGAA
ncbi:MULTISPECIES: conjugal transfer protein TraG N-terminal domain-containing protein [unclassified Modicisalibacter]|uniref:conjugal transfer protein TraG N-terminal domain-containing protein n=1 Tax=unclassified Modicisalibacter TaxID=2679913 RepID=UPI001CCA7015|nr:MULTISPECIES: conjugal transfer protein TraG N-terminal domain-containing protein [unclassified Modicisalibacter]MBZ9559076.1 conjugal transfer protein TraG N-terminal domain-containing protein [Modicisalibacter sp. R2A 31.J]MBZ9576813.1 conjugal transfer protein TraG N-terminal domain-containing protein [Modicisalibacter sp. MOD 31.J]